MENKKTSIIYIRLFRPLCHIVLVFVAFWSVYNLRFTQFVENIFLDIPQVVFIETILFTIIAGCLFLAIWFLIWIYELFKPIHWYYKIFLKVWLLWMIIISFIAYLWQWFIFEYGISRFVLLLWWLFVLVLTTIFDIFFNYINSYVERKNPYNVLFIYSNKNFFEKIVKNFQSYDIYKITSIKDSDFDKIKASLQKFDVIITVWSFDKNFLQEVLDMVRIQDKQFYHISENFFLEDLVYFPSRVGPILAFEQKPSPLDWWFKVVKRLMDIIISIIFFVLFFWIYIFIIIFIYLKDWRPIFYKSLRVGRGWKVFEMYKFRSMIKNADDLKHELITENERKWPLFKIDKDPRIPNWWKFLRKTSLDEIPQFINILKWQMSVVWPRPHLPQEVWNYEKWQKRLLSIKPWITGYAQIFGRDRLDFDEEAKLDLYYIQNWSLFLDMFVILSTVKVVFSGK